MKSIFWAYRALSILVLLDSAGLAITRCPLDSNVEVVGTFLFVLFGVLLAGAILVTGIRASRSTPIVWAITASWCLCFLWWAWFDTDASPFIIHELHTLNQAEAVIEIRQFYRGTISLFVFFLAWFMAFPIIQRYASSLRQMSLSPTQIEHEDR